MVFFLGFEHGDTDEVVQFAERMRSKRAINHSDRELRILFDCHNRYKSSVCSRSDWYL